MDYMPDCSEHLNRATFRFHGEINDFLALERKYRHFEVTFKSNPAVKDTIESLNVPHVEIGEILINGKIVLVSQKIKDGDQVIVFTAPAPPENESLAFILDVHLGKLARFLRFMGLDTLYQNDYDDFEIIAISIRENRTILTRDIGILKDSKVNKGRWIRSTNPLAQLQEVVAYFNLCGKVNPFSRCAICNGRLVRTSKEQVIKELAENTRKYFDEFTRCESCGKLYWKGSHFQKINSLIKKVCETPKVQNRKTDEFIR